MAPPICWISASHQGFRDRLAHPDKSPVCVIFRFATGLRHVSHCIQSIASRQQARDTCRFIVDPGESLRLASSSHFDPKGRTSSPFFSRHPRLPKLSQTPTGYSSTARFPNCKGSHVATISPRSKYSPISVGTVIDD